MTLSAGKSNDTRDELREITRCEVCGGESLVSVLDLGRHPMCDDLVPMGDTRICREYPLEVLFCERCRTAHQRFQIPKQDLFPRSYHYRARFTADVLKGMAELVESCARDFGDLAGKKVFDIGCNDGSLLDLFRARGAVTLGIEPTDACRDAAEKGHTTYQQYFSEELAKRVVTEHGQPDFITFTNVFAHIEYLGEVLDSLRHLLGKHTVIVIENHYLGAVLEGRQFDTFYHEHPRTYSFTSFLYIAESLGVEVLKMELPARYGGNIRVFLGRAEKANAKFEALLARERDFQNRFTHLRRDMELWRQTNALTLKKEVARVGKLPAKAFPARASILLRLLGLDEKSLSAVYEKPGSLKVGNYVPGTRIPIRSDDELLALSDQTLPLLNLAWHIPEEIRSYLSEHGYKGSVIDILSMRDFEPGRPT